MKFYVEPLDLFERYTEPAYRERTVRLEGEPVNGTKRLVVDGKPRQVLDVDELLGAVVGYGQKEAGKDLSNFDRYLAYSPDWQDMDKRVRFLDEEWIDYQVIYPSLGLIWDGEVEDPYLANALCRAYNTWAFELCVAHKDRLYPAAHISLRDPQLVVREMERVAKLGCRTVFVGAAPINGRSFGHPDFDPVMVQFAGDDRFFIGSDYPHAEGFVHPVQTVREALSTLPTASVDKILGENAGKFYGI